jgi:hypothetical protein
MLAAGETQTVFTTGLNISLGASKFEIDFGGWHSEGRKFWIDPSPVVVFGEAKRFGTEIFKERDVQRMKSLAEAIPGSYVVFYALKKEFSSVEQKRIRKLAEHLTTSKPPTLDHFSARVRNCIASSRKALPLDAT